MVNLFVIYFFSTRSKQGKVHQTPSKATFTLLRFQIYIRFCAFTLLTKTDKNLSVFVIYDRSHCSVFVKLHKGAEALTLISALKLIVANSLNRKTGKTSCILSHRFLFSSNSTLNFARIFDVEYL